MLPKLISPADGDRYNTRTLTPSVLSDTGCIPIVEAGQSFRWSSGRLL